MRIIEVTSKDEISSVFPKVTKDLIRVGRLSDGGYVLSEKLLEKSISYFLLVLVMTGLSKRRRIDYYQRLKL